MSLGILSTVCCSPPVLTRLVLLSCAVSPDRGTDVGGTAAPTGGATAVLEVASGIVRPVVVPVGGSGS